MTPLLFYENAFLVTLLGAAGAFFLVRRIRRSPPLHLATGWNTIHRQWSTRLTTAGIAVMGAADPISQGLTFVWERMPGDIKSALPPAVAQSIGAALFAAGMAAKLFQQRKLVAEARPAGPIVVAPVRPEPEPPPEPTIPPPVEPEPAPRAQYEAPSAVTVRIEPSNGGAQ